MDVTATDVDGQSVLHCAAGHEAALEAGHVTEPGHELGHEAPGGHEASSRVQISAGGRDAMGDVMGGVVSALVAARANIHAQDSRHHPRPTS